MTVETRDQSTAVLQRVQQALAQVDQQLQRQGVSARQVLATVQQQDSAYTRYAATQDRVAAALARYEAASQRVRAMDEQRAAVLSSLTSTTDQIARVSDQASVALDRQAQAGLRLADAYRQQASAADTAAAADARLRQYANVPMTTPTTSSSGGGGSEGGMGSMAKQFLLYGVGYSAAYGGYSAFKNSIGRNVALSTLAGQTVASTSVNPADIPKLEAYATNTAASGTQPYSAQTILTGLYGFLSQGFSQSQATSMNSTAIGLSQIAGAQDTSQAATALLAMGNGFGWGNNVGASAGRYANYLQAGANIGAYSLADISQSLPNAGLAGLARSGFDPRFVMSAVASGSFSGVSAEETAQNLNSLGQALAKPSQQQKKFAAAMGMDIMPGEFGRAGGAMNWFQTLQQHLSGMNPATQQFMLSGLFGNQSAGRIVSEMLGGTGPRSFASVYGYMGQSQQGKGAYGSALAIEQSTPGQKLQSEEAKLAQSFDSLTAKTLPGLVSAVDAASGALDLLGNLGKKTPSNPTGATPLDTLRDFLTPGGKGFLNIGAARDQAARGQASTGVGAAIGSFFDRFAQWTHLEPGPSPTHTMPAPSHVTVNPHPTGGAGPGAQLYHGPAGGTYLATESSGGEGTGKTGALATNTAAQYARNAQMLMSTTSMRGTTDADMSRFANMVKIAMLEGQGPSTVQSALGLYIQAVKQNPMLSSTQKQLDILNEEKLVNPYLTRGQKAALLPPFQTPNPGMGGLEAGFQSTVVRFSGAATQQQQLILKLEEQVRQQQQQIQLLQQIVANTGTQKANAARTNLLAPLGVNRSPHA